MRQDCGGAMRVFFLVIVLLAGCAAPIGPASKSAPGKLNAEPSRSESVDRSRSTSGTASDAMPQQAERSSLPHFVKGWVDISGKKRDDSILYQDSAACQIIYQQAFAAALGLYPEPQPGEDGTHNAQAVIARQQSVRSDAEAAYTDCMKNKGWRKK